MKRLCLILSVVASGISLSLSGAGSHGCFSPVKVENSVAFVGGEGVAPAVIERALLDLRGTLSPTGFVLQASGEAAAPSDAIRGVRRVVEVMRSHWPDVPVILKPCAPAGAPSVNAEIRYIADGKRVSWEKPGVAALARPAAKAYDAVPSGWLDFRLAPKRREILANADGRYDIALFGDSITHLWEERGIDIQKEFLGGLKIFNAGFSGDRTQNILWACRDGGLLDGYRAKAVAIMIGTNNRRDPPADIAEGIRRIVATVREKQPSAKVFVYNIFPCDDKPGKHGRNQAEAVNKIIRSLDDGKHVFFIPLWDEFLEPDGSIAKAVMPDYLHPSPEGYAIWARSLVALYRKHCK